MWLVGLGTRKLIILDFKKVFCTFVTHDIHTYIHTYYIHHVHGYLNMNVGTTFVMIHTYFFTSSVYTHNNKICIFYLYFIPRSKLEGVHFLFTYIHT